MAKIQIGMGNNCDNDLITTILSNDLSAAYDTVDHSILFKTRARRTTGAKGNYFSQSKTIKSFHVIYHM